MQRILNLIPWKSLTLTVFWNLGTYECRKFSAKKSTKQALIYICGFIAKKLHTKVPGLVWVGEEKTLCDWIDLKSRGSLFYPSTDLLEEVEKYEKIFQKIHGELLDRGRDPIEKTTSAIAAISNRWPWEVIKLFVNVRFFSRLKKTQCNL